MDSILYNYAMALVGKPYIWGGQGPDGFDCSGLCIELYQSGGVLPHRFDTTAQGLYNRFSQPSEGVHLTAPRFGALSFYGRSIRQITHVAFCLDHWRVLDAGGGNSSTTTAERAAEQDAMVRIRPLNYRKDRVGLLLPVSPLFL